MGRVKSNSNLLSKELSALLIRRFSALPTEKFIVQEGALLKRKNKKQLLFFETL